VDIAVPNDIDPDIGLLPGAVVKGIDHFQSIARENNARKAAGVLQAEELIAAHLQETLKVLEFHNFLPRLSAMNGLMEQLSAKQLFFALKDVATDEELAALLHMSEKLLEEEL
jgi:glutamyl-tRNA reductase